MHGDMQLAKMPGTILSDAGMNWSIYIHIECMVCNNDIIECDKKPYTVEH